MKGQTEIKSENETESAPFRCIIRRERMNTKILLAVLSETAIVVMRQNFAVTKILAKAVKYN